MLNRAENKKCLYHAAYVVLQVSLDVYVMLMSCAADVRASLLHWRQYLGVSGI